MHVVDLGEPVADLGEARGHRVHREVLGLTSATSSHNSGADTGAPGLARIEYGEAIVRSRAFWL